jgi:HD-GYP domain-containing protein (c-di-GMP phosphodiesterase class II)
MERHTIVGEQILAPVEFLAGVRALVRHEHERWDGDGYPTARRRGDPARLADHPRLRRAARDDSDRPYRSAMSASEAVAELRRHAGTQFDPRVVEALLEVVGA